MMTGALFSILNKNIISCWINYILTRSKKEYSVGTIEPCGLRDVHQFTGFQFSVEGEKREVEK